jgi:hypothetical protein
MSKVKGDLEAAMASALRIKLNRLGEKAWVEECKREMGWSRTTAYRHLNPELMEKNRAAAAAARANVPTVGMSAPATPAAPAPATAPEPPTNEGEDSEDEKASPLKALTETDSLVAIMPPGQEASVDLDDPGEVPPKPTRETKHPWGDIEWNDLSPEEQEEHRRATRVQAVLADLEGAASQIVKAASELTAAEQKRVAEVVKSLRSVVPETAR